MVVNKKKMRKFLNIGKVKLEMHNLCMNCEDSGLVKEFIESFKKHMEDFKNDLSI